MIGCAIVSVMESSTLVDAESTEPVRQLELPYVGAPQPAFSADGMVLYIAGVRQSQVIGKLLRVDMNRGVVTKELNTEGGFIPPLTLAEADRQLITTTIDVSRGALKMRRGIRIFNADTFETVDFIEIPGALTHALAPQQRLLYIVEETEPLDLKKPRPPPNPLRIRVLKYDLAAHQRMQQLELTGLPGRMVVSDDGRTLALVLRRNEEIFLTVIDTPTFTVRGEFPYPGTADIFAEDALCFIDEAGDAATFVARALNAPTRQLQRINLRTGTVEYSHALPTGASTVLRSQDGQLFYCISIEVTGPLDRAMSFKHTLHKVNAATGVVVESTPWSHELGHVIGANARYLYALNTTEDATTLWIVPNDSTSIASAVALASR